MTGASNSRSCLTGENLKRCAWCGRGTPKGAAACSPSCAMALSTAQAYDRLRSPEGQLALRVPEHATRPA
jgi:hypothetical protein